MANKLETKISLEESREVSPVVSGKKEQAERTGNLWQRLPLGLKVALPVLGFLLLLAGFLGIFLVRPTLKLKKDAMLLKAAAGQISTNFETQNLPGTLEAVSQTQTVFAQLKKDYQTLKWIGIIPLVGGYYRDGTYLIDGGDHLLVAVKEGVEAIQPYADILGFEPKEDEEEEEVKTAQDRLELALNTLEKIQPSLESIGQKLDLAQEEIGQINADRYPEELFGYQIKKNIDLITTSVDSTAQLIKEAGPLAGFLRPLMGMPDLKKYLLIFQNDAELRPTGGFLTAYAILEANQGNFKPLGSFDIYSLDNRFGNRIPAPEPIKKYHKNVFYWHLRDMNLSPDFTVSMATFWENYQKVGDSNVDGIIAVDTNVLVEILKILGPIGVAGWGNFSAENDPRCDCPQVFYELELFADKPVGEVREARKAVLGPLMHSILLNMMNSPRKKWPEFFNLFLRLTKEKHLLFYFFDEDLQASIEAINAAGRIKEYDGDYLHINDSNFGGAKSNMFIEEIFTQEIEVAGDGTVTKTLTIDYRNPAPPSNCNLEAGELCLNGLYRDWLRIYVPQGSELISVEGSEIEPTTYDDEELGKTVFEAFYGDKSPLRPEGKAQVVFKYKLPFKVDPSEPYRLLMQKQPGTKAHESIILYQGKEIVFPLDSDQELSF